MRIAHHEMITYLEKRGYVVKAEEIETEVWYNGSQSVPQKHIVFNVYRENDLMPSPYGREGYKPVEFVFWNEFTSKLLDL